MHSDLGDYDYQGGDSTLVPSESTLLPIYDWIVSHCDNHCFRSHCFQSCSDALRKSMPLSMLSTGEMSDWGSPLCSPHMHFENFDDGTFAMLPGSD